MIPKIIHYAWFGGNELGELEEKCLASWKKYCPDWEIMRWDESNFNPEEHGIYTKQAYEREDWAFVSDVARLYALKEHGGVYCDTDMELIKSIEEFRDLPAFFSFEIETEISTGIIGAEPHHKFIEELYDDYDGREFILPDGSRDEKTNVIRITEIMTERGLKPDNTKQIIENCHIFPLEYFSPKDYWSREIDATDNTYGIHQFTGSWL
ncbi:glycosyltransferase family 32 protein [Marinilactibacillus sp. Marseille-P9653]|uniref:glycosyltransferase family 32 protein n=1 Tax=Marinilactibacillus sp. Marseille-P9653 TaxID=2866583 RepID=UPI001CE41729|nr:glycosyltransferase [Marinilactibacillus sp. Marseille-P9653]